MSLKDRLLSKNNKLESEEEIPLSPSYSSIDLLSYFENNPDISSLTLYSYDKIFVEKSGILVESELFLKNEEELVSIIKNIANQYDRIINFDNPFYTIALANGIKITAMLPPLIKEGAFLVLKRQSKCFKYIDDVIENKVSSREILLFLKECLNINLNVFVTGKAHVDKTNVLNSVVNQAPMGDGIITIESFPKLKIKRDNALSMIKYKGNFVKTLKKAINLAHERIVVSEASVQELITVFEYINIGHSGFLTSFSSKSYENIISSLQNLILLNASNLNEKNALSLIDSSLDLVVFVDKTQDGKERITRVSELIEDKNGLKLQDIFVWKEGKSKTQKNAGVHSSTGIIPKCFKDSSLLTLGFLEEYFEKNYKHNYLGGSLKEKKEDLYKEMAVKSSIKKENKYRTLKEKIKKSK